MKRWLQDQWKILLSGASLLIFLNIYFLTLCASRLYVEDLLYLDILLLLLGLALCAWQFRRWKERTGITQELLLKNQKQEETIRKLQNQIKEISDYSAKWSHEVKLPLSSLRLMNRRNPDRVLAEEMEACMERMQQHLGTMLMSSKLQSLENDVKMEKVFLQDIVKNAVKNQSFFLIREGFAIENQVENIFVYSDRRWLAYILDQLLGNAIKYHRSQPLLRFGASSPGSGQTEFWVEDAGIGVRAEELPYLFDKGYIGSNLRKGDYRSTGMGLYFVKETCRRLGIGIRVDSLEGAWTRFTLTFFDLSDHILLQ